MSTPDIEVALKRLEDDLAEPSRVSAAEALNWCDPADTRTLIAAYRALEASNSELEQANLRALYEGEGYKAQRDQSEAHLAEAVELVGGLLAHAEEGCSAGTSCGYVQDARAFLVSHGREKE